MVTLKRLAVVLAFSIWSATASATPITSPVGTATILGQSYFVEILYDSLGEFEDQSFDDLNPSITFTTDAAASAAIDALLATFPGFNWSPNLGFESGTRVVYSVGPVNYQYRTIYQETNYGPFDFERTNGNAFSFAQFTPTDRTVPEPATTFLLSLALAGLFALRRYAMSKTRSAFSQTTGTW